MTLLQTLANGRFRVSKFAFLIDNLSNKRQSIIFHELQLKYERQQKQRPLWK